jgi:hypothetical protein
VTTEYAHAWVEIFFPTTGWIAFEPTPRDTIARVPAYTVPPAATPTTDASPSADDPTASPSPTNSGRAPGDTPGNETDTGSSGGAPVPAWSLPLLILGFVTLLAAGAVVTQSLQRRSALNHAGSAQEEVTVRYVDFLGWCSAAGYGRRAGETPREHAARLAGAVPAAGDAVAELAELAAEALWAPPNGLDPARAGEAASQARAALGSSLSRRSRTLAALGWGRWRSAE